MAALTPPKVVRAAPHASSTHQTLNIPERQVLEHFGADPNFTDHHRILFVRIRDAVWVCASPTHEVYESIFSGQFLTPLPTSGPFPAAGRPLFCFGNLTPAEIAALRARALQLADVLGVAQAAPATSSTTGTWRFGDTAHPSFGADVPLHLFGSDVTSFVRGGAGMVEHDAGDAAGVRWTHVELIAGADLDKWLAEKRTGAGRDPRVLPIAHPATAAPLFRDALKHVTTITTAPPLIFRGPSALKELAGTIADSGVEVVGYYQHWLTHSGVHARSATAIEVGCLLMLLHYLLCVDLLDVHSLVGAEHLARRTMMLLKAVKRSPKKPDYSGLEIYLAHLPDGTGNLRQGEMDTFVSKELTTTANILKQQRLTREEEEKEETRIKSVHPDRDSTPASGNKNKTKNKNKKEEE